MFLFLNTRAATQGEELRKLCLDIPYLKCTQFPLIEISAYPKELIQDKLQLALKKNRPQTLIFSSIPAVEIAVPFLKNTSWQRKTIFAIGQTTALILKKHGFQNVFYPDKMSSEGLLDYFKQTNLKLESALIICGEKSRNLLLEQLNAQGILSTSLEIYSRILPPQSKILWRNKNKNFNVDLCLMSCITSYLHLQYLQETYPFIHFNTKKWLVFSERIATLIRQKQKSTDIIYCEPNNLAIKKAILNVGKAFGF